MTISTKATWFWLSGLILIPGVILLALSIGAVDFSITEVFYYLWVENSTQQIILYDIRLPRAVVAFLAGGALAVSGCLLQGLTRNTLACPSLLGINQGASCAIIMFLLWVPFAAVYEIVPIAFAGGLVAACLTYFFANGPGFSPLKIALVGITVNGLFFGLANTLLLLFPERAQMLIFNINGSVAGVTWLHVLMMLPWLTSALVVSLFYGRLLNLLRLGEQRAQSIGINIKKHQMIILLLAVVLACAAVSGGGPITFLGLLIPHVLRHFLGENYQQLIPLSFIYGGLFLLVADISLRWLNPISETPVGILVAILGAPLLMNIAYRKKVAL